MTSFSIKIQITFLFLMWLSCSTNKPTAKKTVPIADNYRVAFYNVENLFDTIDDPKTDDNQYLPTSELVWTQDRYERKLQNLSQVIKSLGKEQTPPSILGMCEIENKKVLQDLLKFIPNGQNMGIVHRDSPDERGIDVGLLYDKNAVKILDSEFFTVNLTNDKTREILYTKAKLAQDELHIFVNHWSSRREGKEISEPKRMKAAQMVRNKIDKLFAKDPESKIIIMGDFNDEPTNKSITQGLKAQKPTGRFDDGQLYNLSQVWQQNGEGSYYYDGWNALDQIIVSGELLTDKKGLHTMPSKAQIYNEDWLTFYDKKYKVKRPSRFMSSRGKVYGGYSDHFPVYLELEVD